MSKAVRFVIYICLLVGISLSNELLELDKSWVSHKRKYSLVFKKEEDVKRKLIFKENLDYINQFNKEGRSSTLRLNMFAHLTDEEMENKFGTTLGESSGGEIPPFILDGDEEPDDRDWREKGAVTRVKTQGSCGADYAFAAIGSVEGRFKIVKGGLESFSEQEIIDCTYPAPYRNMGCSRGQLEATFKYMDDNGITTDSDYYYTDGENDCQRFRFNATARPRGHFTLKRRSELELSAIVSESGPVANGIRLTREFRFHGYGILNVTEPCLKEPNYAFVTIGIGSNPKHYIIKNSWGFEWGEQGFGKIARYQDNMCGIASWGIFTLFY